MDEINLPQLVTFLIERKYHLDPADIHRLRDAFTPKQEQITQRSIDLHEIAKEHLLKTLELRNLAISMDDGSAREWVSELTKQITTLARTEKETWNMSRLRAVEIATVDLLNDMDPALQQDFLDRLEKRLNA